MRDRLVRLATGGQLAVGLDARSRAWLELTPPKGAVVTVELSDGELLMAIEALAMVYGELCGARPDSLAYGVSKTLRNRTRAARERGTKTRAVP
jgi:hypothetical protein